MEPFDNITKTCSKCDETVAQVIPPILPIKLFLNKANNSKIFCEIITLVEEHKKSVENKRLDKFLYDKTFCVSTFLDPRFKLTFQQQHFFAIVPEYKKRRNFFNMKIYIFFCVEFRLFIFFPA